MPSPVPSLSSHSDPLLIERFQRLKKAVLDRRPELRRILTQHGRETLFQYSEGYYQIIPPLINNERSQELFQVFENLVADRLGAEIAKSTVRDLQSHPVVSTADHHGPLVHPFFLNSNFVAAAPLVEARGDRGENVIVLSCANVSLNNSSYPRGILFHDKAVSGGELYHLPFFRVKDRHRSVYGFEPYTRGDILRYRHLPQELSDRIQPVLDAIYLNDDVLAARSYEEQITKTNFLLWNHFFLDRQWHPDLVYIDQESLVADLLLKHHLEHDTLVHELLMSNTFDESLQTLFDGITGAFSMKDRSGTYLFWALSSDARRRVGLWKQGGELQTLEGRFRIACTPEAIQEALRAKRIIPSTLLCSLVLAFYYGLKCLGGFSQVDYLTQMKQAYITMLMDHGLAEEARACRGVVTNTLCADFTVAMLDMGVGAPVAASGIDLLLYGNKTTWPTILQTIKTLTLEHALDPMMPEFYQIIYPVSNRNKHLSAITSEEITTLAHHKEKIIACARI